MDPHPISLLFVIEDERMIRELLVDVLEDAGHRVEIATNGDDAIGILDRRAREFDAVITDIRLGSGPDGWAVARHARKLAPDLPIIYLTGDSAHEWSTHGVPGSQILHKPFSPFEVVKLVASVLTPRAEEGSPEMRG